MKKALIVLVTVMMTVTLLISCGNDPFFHYVEFDSNGGTAVERQIVRNGEKATEPKNPTKGGTEFVDWYDGDNVFDFNTEITKDYKLTAKWADGSGSYPGESTSSSHTVTFVLNGGTGTGCEAQTIEAGGKAKKPAADPKLTNAVFKFWSADGGKTEFNFDTVITKNTTLTAVWQTTFKVGDTGPAGGTIFYINTDTSLDWKYLEAAPSNASSMNSSGGIDYTYQWGPDGNAYELKVKTGIGEGKNNTQIILSQPKPTYTGTESYTPEYYNAAKACDDYGDNTDYDDWFLPSKDELNLMYTELKAKGLGGTWGHAFTNWTQNAYWSSSEKDGWDRWAQYFDNGKQEDLGGSGNWFCVRPVRSFAEVTISSSSGSSGSSGSSSGTFTVSFDVNGGSGSVDSQTVDDGGHATKPATDPTTENKYKTFDFWSADGTTEYKFAEATVTADIELKAVWKDKYTVGGTGPAGGYIFYDAGENGMTSQYVDESGVTKSYTWRYLEAAPSDMTAKNSGTNAIIFGYYRTSATSGTDLQVVSSNNTAVGTGRSNTRAIVNALGETAYCGASGSTEISTSLTTSNYAAILCDKYVKEVDGVTYDDWFLPSKDELDKMYENLYKKGLGSFATTGPDGTLSTLEYLSSSEYTTTGVYSIKFVSSKSENIRAREDARFVRACRAF